MLSREPLIWHCLKRTLDSNNGATHPPQDLLKRLKYKAHGLGKELIAVKPHYTSQKCSGCGEIVKKSLSVRTHKCLHCGLVLNRNHNAAINILTLGLQGQGCHAH